MALNAHFFPKVLDSLRLRESSLLLFHQGMHRHRFHCRKRNGEVCNRSTSVFLGVGASKISLVLRKVVFAVQSAFGLLPSARRKYCEEAGATLVQGFCKNSYYLSQKNRHSGDNFVPIFFFQCIENHFN